MTAAQLADLAIRDATIVTMAGAGSVLAHATVVVSDGTIESVGDTPTVAARRTIDARGGILLPGLINAHTHLAMTMFRGLADDRDLAGFLARVLPAEAAVLSDASVAAGASLGTAESLLAGVTSALDMYFFPEASEQVAREAGLRLHGGPVFVEADGPDHRPFAARVAWAEALLAATPPRERWVCPHSTYLLDDRQLRTVGELAARLDARVHVHAAETAAEIAQVRERHGRSPIEVLHDAGLLGPHTVLAHAVHLDDDDLSLVAASGASVAHCPASNLKLGSGLARIPDLLAAGVAVALGTDGAASANDLDLWMAMRLAAYSQANDSGAGALTAEQVLLMATTGGARAIGLADELGSIEVGKRADLVLLDADSPSLAPSYDPVSTAVYAAGRGDVRTVVADGQIVVDDGVLATIDLPAALRAVRALVPEITAAVDG